MKVMTKKVYYCEFCGNKKGLSAPHMKKHEKRCTMNPYRTCGLCSRTWTDKDWDKIKAMDVLMQALRPSFINEGKVPKLIDGVDNSEGLAKLEKMINCPACTFTYLRTQIGTGIHWEFDLPKKMKEYLQARGSDAEE